MLADGTRVKLELFYRPQQQGWYFNLTVPQPTGDFVVKGRRLVTSPNMLRQFRELISFGLGFVTNDNSDPTDQDIFSNGNGTLVLLNAADVAAVESIIFAPL